MTIDTHFFVTALLTVVSALFGWLGRELWQAVQKLRADLSELQTRIGTDYVRYDRLKDAMQPVMEALHDIRNRLDSKADK